MNYRTPNECSREGVDSSPRHLLANTRISQAFVRTYKQHQMHIKKALSLHSRSTHNQGPRSSSTKVSHVLFEVLRRHEALHFFRRHDARVHGHHSHILLLKLWEAPEKTQTSPIRRRHIRCNQQQALPYVFFPVKNFYFNPSPFLGDARVRGLRGPTQSLLRYLHDIASSRAGGQSALPHPISYRRFLFSFAEHVLTLSTTKNIFFSLKKDHKLSRFCTRNASPYSLSPYRVSHILRDSGSSNRLGFSSHTSEPSSSSGRVHRLEVLTVNPHLPRCKAS